MMLAAVAVNVIFWGFVNRDNGGIDFKNDGRWVEFVDQNFVRFITDNGLNRENKPAGGVYWFNAKNRLGMFYEKIALEPKDDPNVKVKEILAKPEECESFSNVEDFTLLKNCPYDDDDFDFVYFKHGGTLVIVGINADYFSKKETTMLINNVVIYKK